MSGPGDIRDYVENWLLSSLGDTENLDVEGYTANASNAEIVIKNTPDDQYWIMNIKVQPTRAEASEFHRMFPDEPSPYPGYHYGGE